MKKLTLCVCAFGTTLFIGLGTADPQPLGTWKTPSSKITELFGSDFEYDPMISHFDRCFLLWDGYLSSVRSCVTEAFDRQESDLIEAGFDLENLSKLSDYWRDTCSRVHPDEHELSRLGFLECFYNGRDSWNDN